MRLLVSVFLLAVLAAPAAAQITEELKREEMARVVLFGRVGDIDKKLKATDVAGARADLDKLIADLAIASHPGEEVRRRIISARSVLAQGELFGTHEVLVGIARDYAPTETELSREGMGDQLRLLGRSLLGDTVPPTMTSLIEQVSRGIENYPSFYATWTRRQLEGLHFACARRDLALAKDLVRILAKGVGQLGSDLDWRQLVEDEWTRPLEDERTRPQVVVAALRAFPTNVPVPPGSPYDHWVRVHHTVLILLMERGNDEQRKVARAEWVLSNSHLREF